VFNESSVETGANIESAPKVGNAMRGDEFCNALSASAGAF
jgi:hypothetical protein